MSKLLDWRNGKHYENDVDIWLDDTLLEDVYLTRAIVPDEPNVNGAGTAWFYVTRTGGNGNIIPFGDHPLEASVDGVLRWAPKAD